MGGAEVGMNESGRPEGSEFFQRSMAGPLGDLPGSDGHRSGGRRPRGRRDVKSRFDL